MIPRTAEVTVLAPGFFHLCGQALLHLGTPGNPLDEPRQLGEPGDTTPGDIGDMGLTVERDEMVLTHRIERDLAHHHDLLIVLLPEEGVDDLGRVAVKPVEDLGVEGCNPLRGVEQTLALGIFTQSLDYLPYRLLDPALVDLVHPGRKPDNVVFLFHTLGRPM